MSAAAPTVERAETPSAAPSFEITHLSCCREFDVDPVTAPTFCGAHVESVRVGPSDQDCVVCIDIDRGLGCDGCIYGGKCPE